MLAGDREEGREAELFLSFLFAAFDVKNFFLSSLAASCIINIK